MRGAHRMAGTHSPRLLGRDERRLGASWFPQRVVAGNVALSVHSRADFKNFLRHHPFLSRGPLGPPPRGGSEVSRDTGRARTHEESLRSTTQRGNVLIKHPGARQKRMRSRGLECG